MTESRITHPFVPWTELPDMCSERVRGLRCLWPESAHAASSERAAPELHEMTEKEMERAEYIARHGGDVPPTPRQDARKDRLGEIARKIIGCLGGADVLHGACVAKWEKGAAEIRAALEAVVAEEREACAMLHESIDPACDHERLKGHPGARAMSAVIEYRDAIRARGLKE